VKLDFLQGWLISKLAASLLFGFSLVFFLNRVVAGVATWREARYGENREAGVRELRRVFHGGCA
jgi:galactose mutarotase-like enzyme